MATSPLKNDGSHREKGDDHFLKIYTNTTQLTLEDSLAPRT
jgi:hypothetical protein